MFPWKKFRTSYLRRFYKDVVVFVVVRKAYDTRCSQAVPHPSTILARRCLTAVIGREQVCSSWYGRRQRYSLSSSPKSSSSFSLHSTSVSSKKKRAPRNSNGKSQIKNIKLQIVTDIKVRIDSSSLSGFRFGWGRARLFTKKSYTKNCTIVFRHVREKNRTGRRCVVFTRRRGTYEKPTTPGVPRRSPIQVLSWPDDA